MATKITDQQVTATYNSFSGSDIRAFVGPNQFGEMQGISYSVTREKAPIYTCGSPDPRAFSRNKRGIAGSLIWTTFDRHALLNLYYKSNGKFVANIDDVHPSYIPSDFVNVSVGAVFASTLVRDVGLPVSATVDQLDSVIFSDSPNWKKEALPWYSDQMLPFDISLAGVNENGAAAAMKIFGVEILNEGYGISVDDSVSEMQATWVARGLEPLQALPNQFPDLIGKSS